jgi:hypothetical protein
VRSTEKIKKLIRNLNLDVYTNSEADQSVLSELLQAQEKSHKTEPAFASPTIRRKTMFAGKRTWKVAALVAVVIGAGAISVVAVNIGRYYYKGKTDAGVHIFHSEDWETVVTLDDKQVTDVEQTRQDLEEIEGLRQQGKNELLKVEITMTDGTLEKRVHVYKYELSDGRTIDQREGGSEGAHALSEAQWAEWRQLRKAGPGEDLGTDEKTVEGFVFSFKRERYCLSDGTEVVYSVGYPKDEQ